jgi:molybdate transport system ATP-binding protein
VGVSGDAVDLTLTVDRAGFRLRVEEQLPATGLTVLFGPSGSGKTTVLRCVAGLEPTATGRVCVGGEVWLDRDAGVEVPTHERGVGYVFQDAALFPHLDVRGNLEFGLQRTPVGDRELPFEEVVGWMGLEGLIDRDVRGLSGGERQRVAMARAVLAGPRMLLLDEPFASLDRASRRALLPYLEELRNRLAVPVLHVTHDPARLADHVLLLEAGEVTGRGGPEVLPREEPDELSP